MTTTVTGTGWPSAFSGKIPFLCIVRKDVFIVIFGHPPPDPQPLRARLIQRLTYLEDLLRGGLDDYFASNHDFGVRQAFRSGIERYITQVEALLASSTDDARALVDQVLMDIPVSLVDEETGATESFTVVGPDEVDPDAGCISFLSPLGSALLLRRVEETIVLEAPGGRFLYRVRGIGRAVSGA